MIIEKFQIWKVLKKRYERISPSKFVDTNDAWRADPHEFCIRLVL